MNTISAFALAMLAAIGLNGQANAESAESQNEQSGPSSSRWSGYLSTPDEEKMSMQAVSPPVVQGGARITVMIPPEGFDSAAYVSMSDSVGIYYIDKVDTLEEANRRADAIGSEVANELGLVEQKTETGSALTAKSYVPANKSSLTMVNIIVAQDPFAGITTTLAFTYGK